MLWLEHDRRGGIHAAEPLSADQATALKAWYAGDATNNLLVGDMLRAARRERYWLGCDCRGDIIVIAHDSEVPLLHPRKRDGLVHLVRMGRGADHDQRCPFRSEQQHVRPTVEPNQASGVPDLGDVLALLVETSGLATHDMDIFGPRKLGALRVELARQLAQSPNILVTNTLDYARKAIEQRSDVERVVMLNYTEHFEGSECTLGRSDRLTLSRPPEFVPGFEPIDPPWLILAVSRSQRLDQPDRLLALPVVNCQSLMPVLNETERATATLAAKVGYAVHSRTHAKVLLERALPGGFWLTARGEGIKSRALVVGAPNIEAVERINERRAAGEHHLHFHFLPNRTQPGGPASISDKKLSQLLWRFLTTTPGPSPSESTTDTTGGFAQ